MPRKIKPNRFELDDANRREDIFSDDYADEDEIDPEVKDIFQEAQELDYGSEELIGKMHTYTARSPKLTGGDLDASWEYADVGEETVDGQNPTPDQSNVDDDGEAMGIEYDDDEPLRTTEKPERRDREPWELNPRSTQEFRHRIKDEFGKPLKKFATEAQVKPNQRTVRPVLPRRKPTQAKRVHTQARNRQTSKSQRMARAKAHH